MDWLIVAADARCGMGVCQVGGGLRGPCALGTSADWSAKGALTGVARRRDCGNLLDQVSSIE